MNVFFSIFLLITFNNQFNFFHKKPRRDPSATKFYNFDVPYEKEDLVTEEERNVHPKTIQEVMKDVVLYVEVRTAGDNRTDGVKKVVSQLGAKVNDRLLK